MEHFPILPQPLRWVLGSQARRYDTGLRRLVSNRGNCRYIAMDFAPDLTLMSPDGFHPGPKIYAQWSKKVYRALRKDTHHFTAHS